MKILSIDYGNKRIGLALGETDDKTAVPFGMIENRGKRLVLEQLLEICAEEDVEKIIVGMPFHGKMESIQAKIITEFIQFLKNSVDLSVEVADETFTSKIAERDIMYRDLYKDRSKGWKDAAAAAEILKTYMERN